MKRRMGNYQNQIKLELQRKEKKKENKKWNS